MTVTRLSQQNGTTTSTNINGQNQEESKDTSLSKSERKILLILFLSLVIDLLAFTVILPLLPSLLDYYGSREVNV